MSREKEFAKNTIILAIGRYLPKLFTLITLPIITGSLTKQEYGTFDLISTLIALLLPAVTLQIQSAAFRFLIDCRGDKKKSSSIISNILIFTFITSLITVVLFYILYQDTSRITKYLICMYFFLDIMYVCLGQITRGLSFNKVYSKCALIMSFINTTIILIFVYFNNKGLNGILMAYIISQGAAIVYFTYNVKIYRYFRLHYYSKSILKELISYSWPMVPNNLSTWVLKVSDRLVITMFIGIEATAVYAVANKIPNLLSEAQGIMVMAWQENASLSANDKDSTQYYSVMFDRIFRIIMGCTYLLVALMPLLFVILIKGDYKEAYYQMPILIIGTFFYCMSSFQGGIYIAYKRTKDVALSTVAAAIVNIVVNLLLIKFIGITAASISTLISYFVLFIYRMIDIKKIQQIKYNYFKIALMIVLLLIICGAIYSNSNILIVINFLMAIVFAIAINRELIKNILNRGKK